MSFVPTAQQEAIFATPPPLRIEAGAGTGKTATITGAIARAISAGEAEPDEILGITFTNKAAAELAQRIRTETREVSSAGVESDIHTYHGFAHRLLAEFGPLIGLERHLEVITPTFTRQLLLEAIDDAPHYAHLPLHNRRSLLPDLAKLSSDLGDNLASASDLLALPVSDAVTAQRREMAEVIARFEREKQRLDVVDYADLLFFAQRLLTTHPGVASTLRDRYRLVLLDEYQDTSPAQRMLLQAAFGSGFPVIAVGDPDQTIYEWRGASLHNFAAFPEHFPRPDGDAAPTLPLTLNRRSGGLILEVANRLRSQVDDRPRSPLEPVPGTPPGEVTASWYRTARSEANGIADLLHAAHDDGIQWADMAVLFRKNADISLIRQTLAAADIPAEVASVGGLLEIPEIVEVHAWLRVLDDPADTAAFARLLMGSRYRLGLADLRPLADWTRSGRRGDPEIGPTRSPIEAIDALDDIDGLGARARTALAELGSHYRVLLEAAQGVSLVELVRGVLDVLDAWREIESLPLVEAVSTRLNVYRFLDLAESWSPLEGRPSLTAFLEHLDLMSEGQSEELDTARISTEDAVTLITVHRAKGLEWDVVCLPNLTRGTFPSSVRRAEDPFSVAAELPFELRLDRGSLPPITAAMDPKERKALLKVRHTSQEWRLAYVAATRARQRLHVSGAYWYGVPVPNKRSKEPSEAFEIVAAIPGVENRILAAEPGARPATLRPTVGAPTPDPLFGDDGWAGALRAAVSDPDLPRRRADELQVTEAYDRAVEDLQGMLFALPDPPAGDSVPGDTTVSVTGLVTYARCPRQYFWSEVDRLPRRPSPAARRGVDVHRRIELHNLGTVPLEDADAVIYDAPGDAPRAGHIPPYEAFLTSEYAQRRPILVEVPFTLRVDGGVVRGRVDAVYEDDGWEIVDFKSGRPSDDPAMAVQLQAYAVAADAGALSMDRPDKAAVSFVFLGDGCVVRREAVDEAWLIEARTHLGHLLGGISSEQFDPTPSERCMKCDFVRFCPPGQARVARESAT